MIEDFYFTAIIACSAALAYIAWFASRFYYAGNGWLDSHQKRDWTHIRRRELANTVSLVGAACIAGSSLLLFAHYHESPVVGIMVSAVAAALVGMALWLATILAGRAVIAPVAVACFVYSMGSHFHDENVMIGAMFGIFIGASVAFVLSGFACAAAVKPHSDWVDDIPRTAALAAARGRFPFHPPWQCESRSHSQSQPHA